MVAVGCGDGDNDRAAISHCRVGRGDGATHTRRRNHTVFVDGKLRRNRVVVTDICESVGFRNTYRFVIHRQPRQVPAHFRNDRIGDAFTAGDDGVARRRNGAVYTLHRCYLVRIDGKGGAQGMIIIYITKCISVRITHIHIIHKHRVNMLAVGSGDGDGHGLIIIHRCSGRSNRSTLPCRRRYRVTVDGKLRLDCVFVTDIRKGVSSDAIHWGIVHQQGSQMPALGRNERVGDTFATEHRRRADRRDGTLALNRSRDAVRIAGKRGPQLVCPRHIIERIGRVRTLINAIGKDRVYVVAIIGGNRNRLSSTIFHHGRFGRHRTAFPCRRRDGVAVA